jgi:hypothetical protein
MAKDQHQPQSARGCRLGRHMLGICKCSSSLCSKISRRDERHSILNSCFESSLRFPFPDNTVSSS